MGARFSLLLALAPALGAATIAGCSLAVEPKDGTLGCSTAGACPPGYLCVGVVPSPGDGGLCYRTGHEPDLVVVPHDLAKPPKVDDGGMVATGGCADLATTPASPPATCGNRNLDPGESDVDCGGACGPCDVGRACARGADCASATCTNKKCAPPACDDQVQNQGETDLDCGGPCARCAKGRGCRKGADCVTDTCAIAACDVVGTCVIHPCTNGARDPGEADVDCGGSCKAFRLLCAGGQTCGDGDDCLSGSCSNGVCFRTPDIAQPVMDLAAPQDGGAPPDLAPQPDLAPPPDLGASPPPDLAPRFG